MMYRSILALALLATAACSGPAEPPPAPAPEETATMPIADDIEARLAQFAPAELSADLSGLSTEERKALAVIVEASRQMDAIFLRQAWTGNPELRQEMSSWTGPRSEAAKSYFDLNFGPWDRLAERQPFVGDKAHPAGAGFYPEDMTTDEFNAWIEAHPGDREAFESLTTVIRRGDDGGLVAVPYSEAYKDSLAAASDLLREAANYTANDSLKKFLELRADAFGTDDYYASDFAWMDLDAPVEVTIGPYETYEDELFGYKAAFEAFVTIALPEESAALERFKARLPWLERNLPIPDEDKNLNRGSESPIRVVDLVYNAGDAKAGVQTVAFNLPNDERVREAKGSKKVLLRNVMRAKYDRILVPIAQKVLSPENADHLSFDAFLDEVLHHELSHGLGPGKIVVDGRDTEVRLELKDLYSTLEEAKADVMGVYNILALIDEGEIPAELRDSLEPTYVAGLIRGARFGLDEAHGQGTVAQLNFLLEKGALELDDQGRLAAVSEKFPGAIRDLLHELLTLQARGDYDGSRAFLDRYGVASDALRDLVGRLGDLPVDIRPLFKPVEVTPAS